LNANKRKKHRLSASFKFGFEGIFSGVVKERNMQIHIGSAILVVLFGLGFSISPFEWIAVLLAIGGMLALELMNTAVERTVDLYTCELHPLAKQAKDSAAGAVLIFAIISVIIGLIIFIPKIIAIFHQ
jgi:undecaprenol kinase